MLSLGRNEGESLLVGSDVKITVLSVRGNRVKVGVQAPPDVPIIREELATSDRGIDSSKRASLTARLLEAIVRQCGGSIVILKSSLEAADGKSVVMKEDSLGNTIVNYQK